MKYFIDSQIYFIIKQLRIIYNEKIVSKMIPSKKKLSKKKSFVCIE